MHASNPSVLVIAHRGARAFTPENTLEAIEKAAATGADAVEIDVRSTRDGEMVVMHDDDLVRCTDARERFPDRSPWRVCDFSGAEIGALDAGSWYVGEIERQPSARQAFLQSLSDEEADGWIPLEDRKHYASGAVKVPTLAACLEACRRLGLEVHLELKAAGNLPTRLTEKVLEAIAAVGMTDTALISSFDHGLLARVRELGITVRTAVLTSERLYDPVAYLARLGAQAYCPGSDVALGPDTHEVDVETIRAVRRAGSEVYVWTVNDRARMRELIDAGVNGIYTDFPNRLRALVTR